ncbi:restriction endonuclease subunit S [Mammaliicoccus sciuri]|uniref:restriction endonuclease subunit S n=1 Tax=Mammaliicoccus sciuri TaxID=1296 RepID=UPI00289CA9B7|nr:restriction endonuclease subunit S [Mammaliicoccus sciuri]
MTNQEKKVPELRFPEFGGEWEEKKLNQIVKFSKGKLLGKKDLDESGENYCILYGELYTKYGFFINEVKSKTNVNIEKLVKGENNQVLLPSSGETAEDIATASSLNVKDDVYIGGDLNILTPINKDGNFISLSMNGINKWKIAKLSQGKTVVHLYNEHLKTLNLNIPVSREEQKKISGFFGKLDRQIELEEQKLAKLEEQKKGYMQKIFSQELRFKDENGNEYPEWEEKNFLDIFKVVPSKSNQIKSSEVMINGNIPVVDQGKNKFLGYSNQMSKRIENYNDLIVYGDHTTVIKKIDEPFIIGGDGVKLLTSKDGSLVQYLFVLLQYFNVIPEGYKRHFSILKTKSMKFSSSKKEQEKIGEFFKKIDNIIDKQSNKVESLKERKQGLLQKMFV